jgi:phosphatidylglycerophosphate synthase
VILSKIPILLIFGRLIIGFFILYASLVAINNYAIIVTILISLGLLSDIFDGIIARKLNVSTEKLRRLDSTIDQVFYLCIVLASYINCPAFFKDQKIEIAIILAVEALAYLVCFLKFKKEIAYHSLGAKIWSLFLFALLIQITFTCSSNIIFQLVFWIGIITRLEIIAITLVLKKWTNYIPSVYHAFLLRKGKTIKRNKLFNG